MGYESVDKLQNLLADKVFHYASDKKKAAGRALGTFVELITYYLIKNWNFVNNTSIETPLSEFANNDITHNVEFTLHGNKQIVKSKIEHNEIPITSRKLKRKHFATDDTTNLKVSTLVDKNYTIKNACILSSNKQSIISAYVNSTNNEYTLHELNKRPYAMFECKRVGIEEGMRKGPQTIEKAKQGSYVARTVSSLQRIRCNDGSLGGILQKDDGSFLIENYYTLLDTVIHSNNINLLRNFILTVGIISNHGNWFTSDNQNKELKVLAQSYDWLIFLTDQGIGEFITDLLVSPAGENLPIKAAFDKSYNENKSGNVFTKVKINYEADIALTRYFNKNKKKVEAWFNIIAPQNKKMENLKNDLAILSNIDWWEVYK
jgi:hypothetical protein